MKDVVCGWIEGSTVIKKCNAETHLKSNAYTLAVHQLKKKGKSLSGRGTPGKLLAQESSGSTQTSIVTHVTNATREQRKQLETKKKLTIKNKLF